MKKREFSFVNEPELDGGFLDSQLSRGELQLSRRIPSLQDIGKVSFHFVRGRNPKKFASALVNFMGKVSFGGPYYYHYSDI